MDKVKMMAMAGKGSTDKRPMGMKSMIKNSQLERMVSSRMRHKHTDTKRLAVTITH